MEIISVCQRKVYIVKNKDMRIRGVVISRACMRIHHVAHTSMRVC
jgi:hypothetical protein